MDSFIKIPHIWQRSSLFEVHLNVNSMVLDVILDILLERTDACCHCLLNLKNIVHLCDFHGAHSPNAQPEHAFHRFYDQPPCVHG